MLNDIVPFKDIKRGSRITLPEYERKWVAPKDFPNLSAAKSIALDTETWDPELLDIGPGWGRGVGHIVGVSLAVDDGSWYFPVRHTIDPQDNLNPENVFSYLRDVLKDDRPKIGANLIYDLGWLKTENIKVGGDKLDVQFAEAILDGNAYSYSLDVISKNYLGEGKITDELYSWSARAYGGKADGTQRANIYRCPPTLVGPYAEGDAINPFKILKKQWVQMDLANLLEVYKVECDLIDLLVDMRWRGMRISEEKAHIAFKNLDNAIKEKQKTLNEIAGFNVNVNSGQYDLPKLYDSLGIEYERTPTGNPSFTKPWLETQIDDVSQLVVDIRKYTKTRDTFIKGAIIEKHTNGYVYPSFHPLKGENGGAVTGRFAASNPPVQQIPSRDKVLAPIVRSCFIPEDGFEWVKADFSSIELRMMAHFSNDQSLIKQYNDNPFTDYHAYVGEMLGGQLPRIAVKTMNFSLVYGGTVRTVSKQMGTIFTKEERRQMISDLGFPLLSNDKEQLAIIFINIYHERFPIAKRMLEECMDIAQTTGQMRTILNRRTTFDMWDTIKGHSKPLKLEHALARYGKNIKRAQTYKALNYRLQGSAADLIKKGMVNAYKAGLFDKIPLHGQVHDELCIGYHPDLSAELKELAYYMETAIKFNVPIIMEFEKGPTWAEAKEPIDIGKRPWWPNS